MPSFAVRNPYFVIVLCAIVAVVGVVMAARMPVDLFPPINIPVVMVATFYAGMPPSEIETAITARYERFFTLAPNIEHIESRSLSGVSLIKVFFQPGSNADAAVSSIANLAMANLRRMPPGTMPPYVLKFDASSLPVCLVALKGEGLDETQLRDLGLYTIRNQVGNVVGASVPQPFGGKNRQMMVYVDPAKLAAYRLSPMDVVRAVNQANIILPAGEIRIGPRKYSLFLNNLAGPLEEVNSLPLRTVNGSVIQVRDIGQARDAEQIQFNVVRIDGQRSVYLPILKQGGDSNTIAVVDGIRSATQRLVDVPESLQTRVVLDQSEFVKRAINNLLHEGGIGLGLTAFMILVFLGGLRPTFAVLLSIPLSALAMFLIAGGFGLTINTMTLGGLALAFSRLIDNSVIVLENIYRHLEMGKSPAAASVEGGTEVTLAVLASTLTTSIVFFPVLFLEGVSKYMFSALAAAVVISMFASYFVAMTVVPLFCARYLSAQHVHGGNSFQRAFDRGFEAFQNLFGRLVEKAVHHPRLTIALAGVLAACSLIAWPSLQFAFFPRTDSGQIVINVKAPAGARLQRSEAMLERLEALIRTEIPREDLAAVVTNLGISQDFSAMYSPNSSEHTAQIQISLTESHHTASDEYIRRLRARIAAELPELSASLLPGGLVDATLSQGQPTPIDVQIAGSNLRNVSRVAAELSPKIARIRGVEGIYTPQDLESPALRINVDRTRAGLAGLTQQEIASNVITALTSNIQIAPSTWIDRRTGFDYYLTVQFPEDTVRSLDDLRSLPLRGATQAVTTTLGAVTDIEPSTSATELTRYQFQRTVDIHVALAGEDQGRVANEIDKIVAATQLPAGVRVHLRGMVQSMRSSFRSFGYGLLLSLVLLYLVLVAQFRSFSDPLLILLAVPPGLAGVLITLTTTGTSLNIMSLMGVLMMTGIVVSNSILIVDFANKMRQGADNPITTVASLAARIRLRPILMTSLATQIGLLPMALKLGEGSESYAPLARAIIGGLTVSVLFAVFVVPAAYVLLHGRKHA